MINFKIPKVIHIYKVSKGKIWYICSCGRQATVKVNEYNKHVRCKNCNIANRILINQKGFEDLGGNDLEEMFNRFYSNGLLDYVEDLNV